MGGISWLGTGPKPSPGDDFKAQRGIAAIVIPSIRRAQIDRAGAEHPSTTLSWLSGWAVKANRTSLQDKLYFGRL